LRPITDTADRTLFENFNLIAVDQQLQPRPTRRNSTKLDTFDTVSTLSTVAYVACAGSK
jgi:hypothetical protein